MSLWNITDANISKPKYLNRGQVVAVNVTAGGSGYGAPPAVTFAAPLSGTTATGTAVLTSGVVTSVTITNPGSGYTVANPPTITFGSGAADATAIYHGAAYADGNIYFVDETEAQQVETRARGIKGPGWWLYSTYTDTNGTVRHKSEMIIALSVAAGTSGDASDDTILVDRTISIDTAPVARSVTAPAATTFVVAASASPAATVTYQWQRSTTQGGSNYADLANGGVYSGVTLATLSISNSTGLTGYRYRCVLSATGASNVNTIGVTLTVA